MTISKMRILLIVFLFLTFQFELQSQSYLHGYIYDGRSGEILIGANIYIPSLKQGAVSNEQGYQNLRLEDKKPVLIQVSYVGYQTLSKEVIYHAGTQVDFHLQPASLQTVEVMANKTSEIKFGEVNIPIERLKAVPNILGEPDILKALSYAPGVSTGIEGSTGLYVRGGSPDQNLILLDGSTVYNASHLFGFMSIFNSSALNNVKLIKGGFSSKYGGRLSSIIDISMKEGNNREKHSEFSIGLISSSLLKEGPIKKGKSSYMVAGRSAYLGLLATPLYLQYKNGKRNFYTNYLMYDFNAKVNFQLPNHGHLFVSTYLGNDANISLFHEGQEEITSKLAWGNKTLNLRYHQPLGEKFFGSIMLNYNRYDYLNNLHLEVDKDNDFDSSNTTTVQDVSLKSQFDWNASQRHYVTFGLEGSMQFFRPVNIELLHNGVPTISPFAQKEKIRALSFFLEDEFSISSSFKMIMGVRLSNYFVSQKRYTYVEPRWSLYYHRKNHTFSASISKMAQPIHLLSTTSLGLNNDIWVPATKEVPPQEAWQASLGWGKKTQTSSLQVEMFYKKMEHQIDYRQGVNFFEDIRNGWASSIEKSGLGKAYGVEVAWERQFEKGYFRLGYTVSNNLRKFENINRGEWYPHRFDRRHDFSITGNYKFNDKWSLSTNLVFSTGTAVSIPDFLAFHPNGYLQPVYLTRNNSRMPSYQRLDISIKKTFLSKRNREGSLVFSLYNALGRRNPFYYSTFLYPVFPNGDSSQDDIGGKLEFTGYSLLRFIPSISYHLKLK